MKCVIVGGGQVGGELAERMSRESWDVVVIDTNSEKLARISEKLDVLTIQGNGASARALEEAGVREAQILVAATPVDEINIMACMIGKKLGDPKTVARVRNTEYDDGTQRLSHRELGVDIMINPERVTALEIAKLIRTPMASEVEYFAGGRVQMMVFRVHPNSEVVHRTLKSLPLSSRCLISAIAREGGDVIIPQGEDIIRPHDHLYVLGERGHLSEIGWLAKARDERVRNVVILGGGSIGCQVAQILQRNRRNGGLGIKIIDRDKHRCEQIASQLDGILVIYGDAGDFDLLYQEEVSEADVVVAVTGDDKTNILSGVLAKKMGAGKAIVEVTHPDYDPILKSLGIDSSVSPRLLTAAEILKITRRGKVLSVAILEDEKAEIIELEVAEGARAVGKTLQGLRLPRGIIVGVIVRQGEVIVPKGDEMVRAGDTVIIFSLPETAALADRYFS